MQGGVRQERAWLHRARLQDAGNGDEGEEEYEMRFKRWSGLCQVELKEFCVL